MCPDFFAAKPQPVLPTLTDAEKAELDDLRLDLVGIVKHEGRLTQEMWDQGVLGRERLDTIFK